jgi:hypothetical protein
MFEFDLEPMSHKTPYHNRFCSKGYKKSQATHSIEEICRVPEI